jgi:hypothetical protein
MDQALGMITTPVVNQTARLHLLRRRVTTSQ